MALVIHKFRDPVEFEEQLSDRLRVCRLVFEALDESTIRDCESVVAWVGRLGGQQPLQLLAAKYRTVLAGYLVSQAVECYENGTFWPRLSIWRHVLVADTQAAHAVLGDAFIATVKAHGLETFQFLAHDGLTYLTPILAHAGIPRYCVSDFLHRLLIPSVQRGWGDSAGELLAAWRSRQTAFTGVDVPVKRFVLFGGSPAADLVDRCLDLISEAAAGRAVEAGDFGLPSHIVHGLRQGPPISSATHAGGLTHGRMKTLPLPRVQLDPWESLGPCFEFPPVPREIEDPSWTVEDGAQVSALKASAVQSQRFRLAPARTWSAELRSSKGVLRTSVFERLPETGVAAFDPATGQLVRDPRFVALSAVWLLYPQDATLSFRSERGVALNPTRNELPGLAGRWAGHRVDEYNLAGVAAIQASRNGRSETIRVVQPSELRPRLEGGIVDAVTTEDGLPVYSRVPTLVFPAGAAGAAAWRIQIRIGDEVSDVGAGEAGYPSVDLERWLTGKPASKVDVRAIGPLGSDLRTQFALVRGLIVARPQRLILPGEHTAARVSVKAAEGVRLVPLGGGFATDISVAAGEDYVRCAVETPEQRLVLLIGIQRLTWTIARDGVTEHRLGTSVERHALDDLTAAGQGEAALIVSTNVPKLTFRIVLKSGGSECDSVHLTTSRDGRAAFPLARFRDTAIHLGKPSYGIDVVANGQALPVVALYARLTLSNLQCALVDGAPAPALKISFALPLEYRTLEARIWSAHRPWEEEPAGVVALPPGAGVDATVGLTGTKISPGRYVVEVAIHDDWALPTRPAPGAPNAATCSLGNWALQRADLVRRAQVSATAVLELLLIEGAVLRDLDANERRETSPLAVRALVDMLRRRERVASAPLRALSELLRRDPLTTAESLAKLSVSGGLSLHEGLKATILLLPLGSETVDLSWGETRDHWATQTCLAAQSGVPAAFNDPDAAALCLEFLDWHPKYPSAFVEGDTRLAEGPLFMVDADTLNRIKLFADLLPAPLLTYDEFSGAGFEWLLQKDRAEAWWSLHKALAADPPPPATIARRQFDRRAKPHGVWDWAAFPQATLMAACTLVRGGDVDRVRDALLSAAEFAPRLVAFDLALAAVIKAVDQPEGGRSSA